MWRGILFCARVVWNKSAICISRGRRPKLREFKQEGPWSDNEAVIDDQYACAEARTRTERNSCVRSAAISHLYFKTKNSVPSCVNLSLLPGKREQIRLQKTKPLLLPLLPTWKNKAQQRCRNRGMWSDITDTCWGGNVNGGSVTRREMICLRIRINLKCGSTYTYSYIIRLFLSQNLYSNYFAIIHKL